MENQWKSMEIIENQWKIDGTSMEMLRRSLIFIGWRNLIGFPLQEHENFDFRGARSPPGQTLGGGPPPGGHCRL